MIQIQYRSNDTRKTEVVPTTTTVRQFLESIGAPIGRGQLNIDGFVLQLGDLDKPFSALIPGADHCFLCNVAKQDNA